MAPPPQPVRLGSFTDGVCMLTVQDEQENLLGEVYTAAGASVSNIPYNLQRMSSAEAERFGKVASEGAFNLYIPALRPDTGAALVVGVRDQFTIDSVVYEVEGVPIPQGDSGIQLVPIVRGAH